MTRVAQATGLDARTIHRGLEELTTLGREGPIESAEKGPRSAASLSVLLPRRQRRPGAGRKSLIETDPTVLEDLEARVEPMTRGDPESPLRWTCKSTTKLADELAQQGHRVSARKVAGLLRQLGYSLQANQKTAEVTSQPGRNAQFEWINTQTKAFQERGAPAISIDTKKKELVGAFKNGGREWEPKGSPTKVSVHDFPDPVLGKAIPYGVYDLARNEGWVSVGIDHDTAEFSRATIETWWNRVGRAEYPLARELLIVADGGGSNGSRSGLWKQQLQELSDRTGLSITVCHFPPGTSKWNQIEHRLFCHITQNWRGRPLESVELIVELISHTTTRQGLTVRAELDPNPYPIGRTVTPDEIAQLQIEPAPLYGHWNYTLRPH